MTDKAYENVVKLGEFEQLRKNLDGSSPASRVLKEIRSLATTHLEKSITLMMEKVDDALFSRAEKAENNQVQTLYFDAMRELRIIRKDVEANFINEFNTRYNRGSLRDASNNGALKFDWDNNNAADLGLVDKEALEESLAISNMANKVRNNCTQSLYSLDKRVGMLLGDPDLEKWCNPLGPEPICNAFKEATQKIETGIEIRLVILKLFDQYVMAGIGNLYSEVNQHLIRRGIMPEIKPTIRKSASAELPAYMQQANTPPDPKSTHTEGGVTVHPDTHSSGSGYATSAHMPPELYQPISALTYLQHGSLPETIQADDSTNSNINLAEINSGKINVLHNIKQSGLVDNLGAHGDMTINMVAMLFDYILDDHNIPDSMRALIGRLQIPVLKVAILDRNFFSKKLHPTRQLLNRLAAIAIGWNEDQSTQDPLYKKIEGIVQTILNEFDDDISLFSTLLDDFLCFLHKDEEEIKIREERSAKVMEGQERLEVARSTTMKEITPRIDDKNNINFVRKFLSTHWKNLLFVTCARNGKDSEEWKKTVDTMDALIWSVKPKLTLDDRKKLVAIQPGLLREIREGMERLSLPAIERDTFINNLIRAHGRTASTNDEETSDSAPLEDTTENTSVNNDTTSSETAETEKDPAPVIEDQFMELAQRLKPGTWVEFKNGEGLPRRVKFSWISPITGSYLFTDRQGLKSANLEIAELAHQLRNTRARIIDSAPLLDRAVSTVMNGCNNNSGTTH